MTLTNPHTNAPMTDEEILWVADMCCRWTPNAECLREGRFPISSRLQTELVQYLIKCQGDRIKKLDPQIHASLMNWRME